MSDARTPAQIEADIKARRERLAVALDEIGVRMHPSTIAGDAKAKVAAQVDRTVGRAYEGVQQALNGVKSPFVTEDGAPRMERVVPAVVVGVALVGLIAVSVRRSKD